MAKVTCKGLTYAKVSGGGAGAPMTYTGGKMEADLLAQITLNEGRDDVKEYADGHLIDSENCLNDLSFSLEMVNVPSDFKAAVLGHVAGTEQEYNVTEDDAPMVGIGFYLANRYKGAVTYEAYWIFKAQCSSGGITSSTRREQTQFEHETINGSGLGVVLASGGKVTYYAHKDGLTTEQLAQTWLRGKAGISGQ